MKDIKTDFGGQEQERVVLTREKVFKQSRKVPIGEMVFTDFDV